MIQNERDRRAFLDVLTHTILFARMWSSGTHRLPDEHLFDLMDVIHNVPGLVSGCIPYFTPEIMRDDYFSTYDSKWGSEGIGLVSLLNEAYRRLDAPR